MPEMTYTPSFLIRASFFRDFVNTLKQPAVVEYRGLFQHLREGGEGSNCELD